MFWTLGLQRPLLLDGCPKPGEPDKLSVKEAEQPKTMGDRLRAAGRWDWFVGYFMEV